MLEADKKRVAYPKPMRAADEMARENLEGRADGRAATKERAQPLL